MVDSVKELTVDLHDYPADAPVFHRMAVRGIVRRGDSYLMVFSRKYGDCKFPGGGQEQGESCTDTLCREMREETGYDVLPETVQEYLLVHERRKGFYGDLLCMDSYYYRCAVDDSVHPQNLQGYEIDEGYEACWLTLPEAIRRNESVQENKAWVQRELTVLRLLHAQEAGMLPGHKEER